MPIEVTCDACFTPHSVKSEYAGKRFKCRECGAALVVPRKAAATASDPLPRRSTAAPQPSTQKPRPARKSKSKSSGWMSGPLAWIAGGVALLVVGVLVLVPQMFGILAMPLALAGIALTLWGALKCLATAFGEDPVCGLMWIFVPFYSVFYTLTRWDAVGRYFLTFVGGILLMWGPLYGLKLITNAQREAREYDPTTEIAEQYDASQLDEQVAAFEQSAATDAPAPTIPEPNRLQPAGAAAPVASVGRPSLPQGGPVSSRYGRQPPPASVLDGRPAPLMSPPRSAEMVIPTRRPAAPGNMVWIDDRGWWYPGTVTEQTDDQHRVMVTFDGWEDRPAQLMPTARLRLRAPLSERTVTWKVKLYRFPGDGSELEAAVEEGCRQVYGYVADSVQVDLENWVLTFETHTNGDLAESDFHGIGSVLRDCGSEGQRLGIVEEVTPSGQLMVGQIHYSDYQGDMPIARAADLALRGYRQYVAGSAQVDEQARVVRFVFDPHLIEGDDVEGYDDDESLMQLMQALSLFRPFGSLSQPEATPYQKPR